MASSSLRSARVAAARVADSLRLQIVAQAKSAHAEWRYIGAAMDVHHGTRELLDELLATVKTRYAAGDARRQDVLQVEVELADLEHHLLRLTANRPPLLLRSSNRPARVMSRPVAHELPTLQPSDDSPIGI